MSSDGTYRAECPGCGDETTFSKGGSFGLLSCDSCTYAPRASVRKEIRSQDTESEHKAPDELSDNSPTEEERALNYPMLENGATMGTTCEYQVDDWSWVIITDIPDTTWGDIFDDDDRADEKVVRFLNLEELTDDEFILFEDCVGCYQHVDTARQFRDHDGAGNYMRRSDFLEKYDPIGPLHPKHTRENGGDDDGDD